jgi:F-type H+-transporting ATPase subunit b
MSLVTPDFGLLVWMTVIFAILFFILAKFGFPIITGMVNKRSDYIGKSLESAREAQRKVDALAEEQKRLIDETKREQSRILNEAAQTRDDIISEARQQARDEAEAIMTQAREDIEAQRESALRDVRRQVADLSVEVAEKLVRGTLADDEKTEELIGKLIDEAAR